ncbi:hypothetical protein [Nocardioides humi]|uniref:Uncharacterized protein n=1 Tax=Nocardioides humi TaxID=449461 RepID=A0ABN1ZRG0_9ACTN|nr:hypothetical protein [Nocardioides humi]
MQERLDTDRGRRSSRFAVPRWAWRAGGAAIAVVLLADGDVVGALGAVLAFAVAEVIFDAAEAERD